MLLNDVYSSRLVVDEAHTIKNGKFVYCFCLFIYLVNSPN